MMEYFTESLHILMVIGYFALLVVIVINVIKKCKARDLKKRLTDVRRNKASSSGRINKP